MKVKIKVENGRAYGFHNGKWFRLDKLEKFIQKEVKGIAPEYTWKENYYEKHKDKIIKYQKEYSKKQYERLERRMCVVCGNRRPIARGKYCSDDCRDKAIERKRKEAEEYLKENQKEIDELLEKSINKNYE